MKTPYKMKGSPMQRNFGVSPLNQNKKKNTIDPPVTHSDTTTTGNPVDPAMIDFLGRQGFSKKEVNALHKAHEKKLKTKKQ